MIPNDVGYKFSFKNKVLHQLELQQRKLIWAKRPEIWAYDVLHVTLWSGQVGVAHSVVENHNTMVAAGHGVGKSLLTAVLACWWIDTHPIGEARVLSTAPTTHQVRNVVWREIQKLHQKSHKLNREYLEALRDGRSTAGLPDHALPGYVTSSATWRSDDGIELGSGRTPPRGREGDAFQGIHGGVFAIADEAVGVSKEMIDTLANNTTANEDRILMLANPTNPASEMGVIWNDPTRASAWSRITISVLDSPHFTDEKDTLPEDVLKYMTNHGFVDRKKVEYGEDSANYKSRILGQWAFDEGMILFPDEVLFNGKETTVIPDEDASVHIGFDVSRSEKGDWSYLYTAIEGWVYQTHEWRDGPEGWNTYELERPIRTEKRGLQIRYLDRWRGLPFVPLHDPSGKRVSEGANERVDIHMRRERASQLRIDSGGMGRAMMDALYDLAGDDYLIIPISGSDPSPDINAWRNMRAYQFAEFARRMRHGEIDIEEDSEESPLVKQLGAIEYKFAVGYSESMLILSKEEMRRKKIKSPDAADAAIYSAALVDEDDLFGTTGQFEVDQGQFVAEYAGFYDNPAW